MENFYKKDLKSLKERKKNSGTREEAPTIAFQSAQMALTQVISKGFCWGRIGGRNLRESRIKTRGTWDIRLASLHFRKGSSILKGSGLERLEKHLRRL